jgi:hypothetical protein
LRKELTVPLANGILWTPWPAFALVMCFDLRLGAVMSSAVMLNLAVAALSGVLVPPGLQDVGRRPRRWLQRAGHTQDRRHGVLPLSGFLSLVLP